MMLAMYCDWYCDLNSSKEKEPLGGSRNKQAIQTLNRQ